MTAEEALHAMELQTPVRTPGGLVGKINQLYRSLERPDLLKAGLVASGRVHHEWIHILVFA